MGEDDSVAVTQAETVKAPKASKGCCAYQEEEASEGNDLNWEPPESYEDSDFDDNVDVTQAETTEAPEVRGGCNAAYMRTHSITRSGLRYPGEEIPACRQVPEI